MAGELILIVEDELIIAEDLKRRLLKLGYQVCGPAKNYTEALRILEQEPVELALLDINLSGSRTGIELAHIVREQFGIPFLFLTSYADPKTVEAAKLAFPAGYIVKPYKTEDLFTSIEIALAGHSPKPSPTNSTEADLPDDSLMIQDSGTFLRIKLEEIRYVQAMGNYVRIFTREKSYLIRHTFKSFRGRLPALKFCQSHKSYIVNLDFVREIKKEFILVGDQQIPVSRRFFPKLRKQFQEFTQNCR